MDLDVRIEDDTIHIKISGSIDIEGGLELTAKFKEFLEDDALKNSKGFGINNTKHRLNLLFGERASFSLTNENEGKVLAKLVIPISLDIAEPEQIGGTN